MLWRLLLSPPRSGPDNMALDSALMLRARRTGESVLRVYAWRTPTLSFGRNQRAVGEYDLVSIAREGLQVVRRPTGGRALLHCREITYSVTAPAHGTLGEAYAAINALLLHALGTLGISASVAAPGAPGLHPSATPCFAEPAAGELVAGGRKLVGSAQWRDGGALLQHGSILVDDDQPLIGAVMRAPADPVPTPATLRALLGRAPLAAEVGEALRGAVRALADPRADWFDVEPQVDDDAARLAPSYHADAWTWRR